MSPFEIVEVITSCGNKSAIKLLRNEEGYGAKKMAGNFRKSVYKRACVGSLRAELNV